MDKRLRNLDRPYYSNGNPKVNYPDLWLIPPLSIVIGYAMVQLGADVVWLEWESDPMVQRSIVSSIGCVFTSMTLIALFTRILDWKIPWYRYLFWRLIAQYLLCVLVPGFLVIGWQYLFFREMAVADRMDGYVDEEFQLVQWMLAVWSIMYLLMYTYAVPWKSRIRVGNGEPDGGQVDGERIEPSEPMSDRKEKADLESELESDLESDAVDEVGNPQGTPLYTDEEVRGWERKIALFIAENRKVTAILGDGGTRIYPNPMKVFAGLAGDQFYMVKNGNLVNRAFIDRVIDEGRYFTVILKSPNGLLKVVTKLDDKIGFKKWWGGPIQKKG